MTSVYFKSSNSLGFNPILQKFYEIICEIILSKTVCGIFLIFCRLRFINNFVMKNKFSEPQNHQKLNIWRPIYFKKISAYGFADLICTDLISQKDSFFQKFFFSFKFLFSGLPKPLIQMPSFCSKNVLHFFSSVII